MPSSVAAAAIFVSAMPPFWLVVSTNTCSYELRTDEAYPTNGTCLTYGDPRGRGPAGGSADHDLGPAAPPRDPHRVAGRDLQRAGLRDRGARGRHRAPALRPQRDPGRRVGGPVRRHRRPHGLLPPHARAVPPALQRAPGDLRGPA